MSLNTRLEALERAAGVTGDGCPECRGVERHAVQYPHEPEPQPERCRACGRNLVTTTIKVVYVDRVAPRKA